MTPLEIEAATFWLVAQCLNQLRHRVSPSGEVNLTYFCHIPWLQTDYLGSFVVEVLIVCILQMLFF
jgi:hypothetical protein